MFRHKIIFHLRLSKGRHGQLFFGLFAVCCFNPSLFKDRIKLYEFLEIEPGVASIEPPPLVAMDQQFFQFGTRYDRIKVKKLDCFGQKELFLFVIATTGFVFLLFSSLWRQTARQNWSIFKTVHYEVLGDRFYQKYK